MSHYRINYDNGQVHGKFYTLAQAWDEFKTQKDYDARHRQSSFGLRIERYEGDGEWSTVGSRVASER